ncbi:MAG: LysM peptidoglycan-binding domain-containing protein [Schleiferiaceae bacterium]|nr:LysM peptidoglycan-binding domain-containing protein [Schleiferiaceae bacterium]
MKYTKLLFTLSTTLMLGLTVVAQKDTTTTEDDKPKKAKEITRAYDYFEAKEFYFAAEAFKKASSKAKNRSERAEITFNLAECYRHMGDLKAAESQYKRAFKMDNKPKALLMQAEMLKAQGEYEDAIVEFQNYKKLIPDDPRADAGIESSKKSIEWIQNPTRYQLTNMKDWNSRESDFAPAYGGRPNTFTEVYFTSTREGSAGKKEDGWTGQSFSDIYVTEAERMKKKKRSRRGATPGIEAEQMNWSTPVPASEVINTTAHEGALCFDRRKKTMYFTRCIKEKNQKIGCQIYVADKRGNDWADPEMVVLAPDTMSSVGHPSLSPDDKFLYFSSDMEGTKGGKDLWVTTYNRREKKWEKATNLGSKINTKGNEMYPFIHDDGYLYFSSDGLPGMGGLDVFRVAIDEETGLPKGDPENLQHPINTSFDDFSIIFEDGDSERGYMASNRPGGRGGDDLYAVYLVPLKFQIDGTIVSAKDGKPVSFASVRLDGTDGTSVVVSTDKDGYFVFDKENLSGDANYKLNFEKQKFLNNTADVTTVGVAFSAFEYVPSENIYLNNINLRMKLEPIEEPIVLPNVFFDLASAELRDESKQALDSVYAILTNNPTIVIELRSHTDYRDTDARNDKLSQDRAQSGVNYLIEKGIPKDRLIAVGRGEREPFKIPENYEGLGKELFKAGTVLTESFIKSQSADKQEIANQINRRTDFKVLRDDYVPEGGFPADDANEDGTPVAKKGGKGEVYVVERGDNLGKIAKKFDINLKDLKELNGGLVGVRVVPGMTLKVTAEGDYKEFDANHYQVQRGDNLGKIAKEVGLKKSELSDLNEGITDRDVQPGMYLRIK